MKRRIIIFFLIFICFILQCTVLPAVSIASIKPNILIILAASFGLMGGKREGIFVGFVSGLLMDIFFPGIIGFNTLILTYIGYLNGFCYRIFYDDDIKMPVILIAASDFSYGILVYVFQFLLRGRVDFFFYLRRIIIPEVIFTMLVTILCYRFLLALNRKLGQAEQRSGNSFV